MSTKKQELVDLNDIKPVLDNVKPTLEDVKSLLNENEELAKAEQVNENIKAEAKNAALNAAAANAVKTAAQANAEMSLKDAEKTYLINKKRYMLNKCKTDKVVTYTPPKILAKVFGKVYTYHLNTIPVTVRFDGTKQTFPKFIYDNLIDKINRASESNTPKEDIVKL